MMKHIHNLLVMWSVVVTGGHGWSRVGHCHFLSARNVDVSFGHGRSRVGHGQACREKAIHPVSSTTMECWTNTWHEWNQIMHLKVYPKHVKRVDALYRGKFITHGVVCWNRTWSGIKRKCCFFLMWFTTMVRVNALYICRVNALLYFFPGTKIYTSTTLRTHGQYGNLSSTKTSGRPPSAKSWPGSSWLLFMMVSCQTKKQHCVKTCNPQSVEPS